VVDVRDLGSDTGRTAGAVLAGAPTLAEIESFVARLGLDAAGLDDAERIDRIAALDSLTCASQAAQSETVADFVVSQRRAAADRGVPVERRDRGLGDQVALARRTSPHRGLRDVALAMSLRTGLPHTRAAFRSGHIDAFKATLVVRETAHLSDEHRAQVDEQLWAEPDEISRLSPRRLVGRLQKAAA